MNQQGKYTWLICKSGACFVVSSCVSKLFLLFQLECLSIYYTIFYQVTLELTSCNFWPSSCLFHSTFVMAYHTKFLLLFLLFRSSSFCFGFQLDIQCLLSVQEPVIDSKGILMSSWDFVANTINGYICRFTGVECWHPDKNKVYALRLGNLGLEGPFPQGLQHCTSLNMLDLSSNKFSGLIPADISWQLSYLSSLDLQ